MIRDNHKIGLSLSTASSVRFPVDFILYLMLIVMMMVMIIAHPYSCRGKNVQLDEI